MTCEQAQPLLSAYFDRELDVAHEPRGRARTCAACDALRAGLQQHEALRLRLALRGARLRAAERISRSASAERAARGRTRTAVRARRAWRWAAVPLAAALAAALSWSVASYRGATVWRGSAVGGAGVGPRPFADGGPSRRRRDLGPTHRQALVQRQGGFRAAGGGFRRERFSTRRRPRRLHRRPAGRGRGLQAAPAHRERVHLARGGEGERNCAPLDARGISSRAAGSSRV